jgi:hypothetical protein
MHPAPASMLGSALDEMGLSPSFGAAHKRLSFAVLPTATALRPRDQEVGAGA